LFWIQLLVRELRSCETRWASRSKIIHIVDSVEYFFLISVFSRIIEDQSSGAESINGARGYLKHFQNLEFAFLTGVYSEIFNITDVLFSILQRKCLDINYCQQEIDNASMRIKKKIRNVENFNIFYQKARCKLSSVIEQNPPKRMKVSTNNMDQTTVCKALYFEILDNIIVLIQVRFKDLADLKYFALVDNSKFQTFANNFPHLL
jgi:hypothetical protein